MRGPSSALLRNTVLVFRATTAFLLLCCSKESPAQVPAFLANQWSSQSATGATADYNSGLNFQASSQGNDTLVVKAPVDATDAVFRFKNTAGTQLTYTWVATAGAASWSNPASWSPARTTPSSSDILSFSNGGSPTVNGIPATETIGGLLVSGNTNVTFANAAPNKITITDNVTGADFSVAGGSQWNVFSNFGDTIALAANASGSVSGSINLNGNSANGQHNFAVTNAGALVFNSGSSLTQDQNFDGYVFGPTGTSSVAVFASGSTFIQNGGSNPFGSTIATTKVIFQTGSLYKANRQYGISLAFNGRTYANLELNGNNSTTAAGANLASVDTLNVNGGTINFTLTGGANIRGNITVANGATLSFSPSSAATFNLSGTVAQTITTNGTGSIFVSSPATLSVSSGTTVNINAATVITGSGAFAVSSGATVGIASPAGISSSAAAGNIQTATRTFNSGANYTYNGTASQITGDGLPTTVNSLRIANTGTAPNNLVTLTQNTTAAGTVSLTTGILDLNGKTFTIGANGSTSTVSGVGTIRGSAASSLSVAGDGSLGTLYFDQTNPGTTNLLQNLTINRQSSGTVSLGNDLVLGTSLVLLNGSFDLGTSTLAVNGDISRTSGSLNAAAGSIAFNGTTAQAIPANTFSPATLKNLAISNPAGVNGNGSFALNGTMTVNGLYTPASSDVISGTGNLTGTGTAKVTRATGSGDFSGQYAITNKTLNNLTVEFAGTAQQGVGSTVTSFGGFKVNNSSGVKLNGGISIGGTLTLANGIFDLNGKTLTLNGSIVNGGGFLAGSNTSDLVVGGTGNAGTLFFTQNSDSVTNVLRNFTLNRNGGGLGLGNKLVITGTYTPIAGTLTTAGFLVLRSNRDGTASVGRGSSSGGYISGNVTVERYIPDTASGRRFRLLTAPVTGTTINASWQEGMTFDGAGHKLTGTNAAFTPALSYGTLITGQQQGTAGTANGQGFDFWQAISNSSASIRYYSPGSTNSAASWKPLARTTTDLAFDNHQAYLLYVRGNRFVYAAGNDNSPVTLRATGALKQGDITIPVPKANSHTLIGNPFAATLDFQAVYQDNSSSIKNYFWAWQAGYGLNTGAYILVQPTSGGSYEYLPRDLTINPASSYRLIHSGQGFFVVPETSAPATGNSITIRESHKATASGLPVFRMADENPAKLYVNFNAFVNAKKILLDGVLARYSAIYSTGENDIAKAVNSGENIAIPKQGTDMIVASGQPPLAGDALPLKVWNTGNRNYQLEIKAMNFSGLGLMAVLEDHYLGTETAIPLNGNVTPIPFTANNDAASKAPDRFRIVFKPAALLPLHLTSLKASEKNGGVVVEWAVSDETGIWQYEVEKAVDGSRFSSLTTLAARGTAGPKGYVALDAQPSPVNYYRIKLIGVSGEVKYSEVVKVTTGHGKPAFTVYPNPVTGTSFQLQLVNKPQDRYTVTLFTAAGQHVLQQEILHTGGSAAETIQLENKLASGIYQLEIKNSRGETEVLRVNIVR